MTIEALGASHGTWQRVLEAIKRDGHPDLATRGVCLVPGGHVAGVHGQAPPRLVRSKV